MDKLDINNQDDIWAALNLVKEIADGDAITKHIDKVQRMNHLEDWEEAAKAYKDTPLATVDNAVNDYLTSIYDSGYKNAESDMEVYIDD